MNLNDEITALGACVSFQCKLVSSETAFIIFRVEIIYLRILLKIIHSTTGFFPYIFLKYAMM